MDFVDLKSQYVALKHSIDDRILRVLEHGQYILGPEVAELERQLAAFCGAAHCITVSSGTEALLIALMAIGLKPGDEVITSPLTFAATAEVIALLGARPVFVDVESDTCNIDATQIEACVTARTRAIIPVSLYGQCADMDAINAVALKHGLIVIEDGAQSFGATYKTRRSGNLSEIGCTSFFPSKPLGCYGDGGAIFTSNNDLAQAMREIRVHGQSARYTHTRIGVGGRMDTLQCAIVLAKLERFDWEIASRRGAGLFYAGLLQGAGIEVVAQREDRESVFGQFTVFVDNRDLVISRLKSAGIPVAVHYPKPLHHQVAYSEYSPPDACPQSCAASERVLSLPMSADITRRDQELVVSALRSAVAP